jgi:hypothetical protein
MPEFYKIQNQSQGQGDLSALCEGRRIFEVVYMCY